MQICFASHNENKVREINAVMPEGIFVVGLSDLGITEDIAETGDTFEENSRIKAAYVFEKCKMPVFADDSGLSVNALNGQPGVYSARFSGPERSDDKNMNLLLDRLKSNDDRSAEFKTVISYLDENGALMQFSGSIKGSITFEKKGSNGFGYDPIFKPEGYDQTFAELPSTVKNNISHRAKAVRKLLDYLHQQHG